MSDETFRLIHASGECEIDLARRELRVLGFAVPVGGRAFDVIEILARSAGDIVTKDELMDRIWPGAIVMDGTLHVHAAAVRKALGPYRSLLKTESGRGYRLLGDWTAQRHDAASPPVGLQQMRVGLESPITNFPATVTRLIGRSAAVARLRDLMSAYRVVTLTGPGGIGKTSLALKGARGIVGDFTDGGWLVELAPLSDPALVPTAVAGVLKLPVGPNNVTPEAVAHAIGDKRLLLVLDNCEHLIEAAANLAETLLALCPYTTIVTTSRETLRIQGEHVYRVPPLDVPAFGRDEADHILMHSGVELFITRTKELNADFAPRADEFASIAAISRRLDGIPLAIEFAAVHAATFGIHRVAAALNDRFASLTHGRRTALPRHRTLRGVLDWGYDLLSEAEQRLLRHLAIFAGGFTFEAAAAVVNGGNLDPSSVVEGIANLVAKSLVALDRGAASRWSLLDTTRAYALEKLSGHGERDAAARRHATYFRGLFASPAAGFRSRMSIEDLTRHSREIDNVRTALDWAFSAQGDNGIGIDLTADYAPVWTDLSLLGECRERCERALLSAGTDPSSNAWAQMWLRIVLASTMIATIGPSERVRVLLTEALATAEALNDPHAQARALVILMSSDIWHGDEAQLLIATEQLRQVAHLIGDPAMLIVAERHIGTRLLTAGRPREAQECMERVLRAEAVPDDLRRSNWHHSEHRAMARAMLARVLWMQGFVDRARTEALRSLEELQGDGRQTPLCRVLYYGICRITPMTGDFETADKMIGRLIEVSTSANLPFWTTSGHFLLGKLLTERGAFAQGLDVLREAFNTCARTGWRISYLEFRATLASALAGVGRLDQAIETLDEAIARASQPEQTQVWYVPELLRIKAEVLLRQGLHRRVTEAEDCLDQAATMAREQHSLFWELRIALGLARLRAVQGRREEAKQILSSVYERFSEGFETPDLRAAKALLDELQA